MFSIHHFIINIGFVLVLVSSYNLRHGLKIMIFPDIPLNLCYFCLHFTVLCPHISQILLDLVLMLLKWLVFLKLFKFVLFELDDCLFLDNEVIILFFHYSKLILLFYDILGIAFDICRFQEVDFGL